MITLDLKEQTDSVLKTLTPREEKVIKMRFGVGDGSEHTLEEVGQEFRRDAGAHSPDRGQGPCASSVIRLGVAKLRSVSRGRHLVW